MHALQIELRCPECAGDNLWSEQQKLKHCSYCGSMLYFEHGLEDRFYLEPRLKTEEDLRKVIVSWKAEKKRAEDQAKYANSNENAQPEMLTIMRLPLGPYLKEFDAKTELHEAKLLYVPYWHFTGVLYQSLLISRKADKDYFLQRSDVDETIPAYPDHWNFRDRGLRFGQARLKIATREMLSSNTHLPFETDAESRLGKVIRAYVPEPGEMALFRFHLLGQKQKLAVLRPYWIAAYSCGGAIESALIDAVYGTIAGYPDRTEKEQFFNYNEKPHSSHDSPAIRVMTSRCPVCGWDITWGAEEVLHFCENCNRALALKGGEIQTVAYLCAAPETRESLYLPFWKLQLRLTLRGKTYESLHQFFRLFFHERLMRNAVHADSVYIPALPVRKMKQGDYFFAALIADATAHPRPLSEGPISGQAGIHQGATMDAPDAVEILYCVFPSASNVNPAHQKLGVLNQIMKETKIEIVNQSLVLLPFKNTPSELIVGSKTFSRSYFE